MMPQLALFIIKGLTPPEHEVTIVEEESGEADTGFDCDLVGISCMTANAWRAYELADIFRSKGKTVILGGVHPTILPDEALVHADAVVVGEAEGVWAQLLKDYQNGSLQRIYHQAEPDLGTYVPKDFSIIKSKRLFRLIPIMTTRGCPYHCDFCCVTNLFGKKIRHIPVENVCRDIVESGARNFLFLDDNIIGQPKYAKELFRAIKPLRIRWAGQASISFAKDTELMKLAAESGCKALFIGLESVSELHLKDMKKSAADIESLEAALRKIRKMGILIHASVIFGFDHDNTETFEETVSFLIKNKVSTVSFNILTPYPGTKTFDEMKAAGMLLTNEWKFYDHNSVVFQPGQFTPYELQEGKTLARMKFYSFGSILRRLRGNLFSPILYLLTNYGHYKQARVEFRRLPAYKARFMHHETELAKNQKNSDTFQDLPVDLPLR
jgi:radical SAM superfamily enzyme YgiQ (UPF0313 family)